MSTEPNQAKDEVMDAETLEALKGSIAKWEGIVAGTQTDEGPQNCPLCIRFDPLGGNGCRGCPVFAYTGQKGCSGTPYDHFTDIDEDTDRFESQEEYASAKLSIAQQEVDFLKSLLPVQS